MSMKKLILPALAVCIMAGSAVAKVTVNNPSAPARQYTVIESPIDGSDRAEQTITLDSKGSATFEQSALPVSIMITDADGINKIRLFSASAGDNITVQISPDGQAVVSGTKLMDDIQALDTALAPINEKAQSVQAMFATDPAGAEALYNDLQAQADAVVKNFLSANADSPAAAYAMLELRGQDFLDAYDSMTPAAKESVFMPIIEKMRERNIKQVEMERLTAQLESGTVQAPAFSLPDMDGKSVSLSDFKGTWVILDFWGSWCRWCVKGFPELKEEYAKYSDKLEVVGIDCNEPQDRWKAAVAKYELPWVNVYYDTQKDKSLLEAYAVQGFPTKVIISPEGFIKKIVVGADPSFPSTLANLIGAR